MPFRTVVCFDDLTRTDYWPAKEFIYDLARVPIFHAGGLDIAKSPRRGQRHNLVEGFDAAHFAELCGLPGQRWQDLYHALPVPAQDYLVRHLPASSLLIGYELTPALTSLLSQVGQPWLDIRLSPLRFASDLYLALRSNEPAIRAAIAAHAVSMQEVIAESCLMAAQVRYRRRYDEKAASWSDTIVYIGQTEKDASLIDAGGRFVRAAQFAPQLQALAAQRRMVYRGHPLAGEHARRERELLRQITAQDVPVCDVDTYELLAMDDDVALVGLSSGVLQEARWFGKQAVSLHPAICEPDFGDRDDHAGHRQIASHVFLGEPLWASILGVPLRAGAIAPPPQPNRLRELHNTWWGYASASLRHSEYHKEMFRLHGGAAAQPDTAALKTELNVARQRIDTLRQEIDGLKEALRVVLRQAVNKPTIAADLALDPGHVAAA